MADAKPITLEGVFECECCGNNYTPTKNKDGSVRKTKWRACSKCCVALLSQGKTKYLVTECAQCGAEIARPGQGRKYCGKRCAGAARRERERESLPKSKCFVCGSEYTKVHTRSGNTKTCSDDCKAALRKETRSRWKERYRREVEGRRPMAEIQAEARAKGSVVDLWEKNAKQAFDHWLKERMTEEQAERYWRATGKPWLNYKLTEAEKYRLQYRLDLEFQVKERMRRQVKKAQRRDGIADVMRGAINRNGSSRKVERELGYSIADLMLHIEKQFTKRMTWDRFTAGEIHIDHIIPQASFDLADDDEWRACWCLSNLQPRWARDNLAKGAKVMTLC